VNARPTAYPEQSHAILADPVRGQLDHRPTAELLKRTDLRDGEVLVLEHEVRSRDQRITPDGSELGDRQMPLVVDD
jgi:hypothetical protein